MGTDLHDRVEHLGRGEAPLLTTHDLAALGDAGDRKPARDIQCKGPVPVKWGFKAADR